jgi:hypothetical protein
VSGGPGESVFEWLRALPATRIADAGDGQIVKVVGELIYAHRTTASPLSRRSCAYYSVRVDQYTGSGLLASWLTLVREAGGVDFYVRDDSGTALVRVGKGRLASALVQDRTARISPLLHDDWHLEALLAERGYEVGGMFFRKTYRASHGVLEAGERIAVAGRARWVAASDAGGSYREAAMAVELQASHLSDDADAF